MGRSDTQYRDQLVSLLPPGKALAAERGSTLWQTLWGFAQELFRVDSRMDDLIRESVLTTTNELLTDYEDEFGIPEPGTDLGKSIAERREILRAKLIAVGQQDPAYFVDIAERLGWTIEIETYQPFFVGYSTVGDTVGNLDVLFRWMVWIIIEDGINWNISQLIYQINKYKPGHTKAFFEFKGCAFSRAFSRDFCSIQHYDGQWSDFAFDGGFSDAFPNNTSYDGVNMVGAFSQAFSISFDTAAGGGFEETAFSTAFNTPM